MALLLSARQARLSSGFSSISVLDIWCFFLTSLVTLLNNMLHEKPSGIKQLLLQFLAWLCSLCNVRNNLHHHGTTCSCWSFQYFHHALYYTVLDMDFHYSAHSAGGGPPGLKNNLRLHPLRIIEQISYEQLLPVKMTRYHFIAMDKRSDSICMLQLSAILISLPIPAFNISWQT